MPDFDIDFCQDRRDAVIGYVEQRYGRDQVAQIITFGTLQARGLAITWQLPSGTRSEALDAEVLSSMYRSGCRNVSYAPESGSPRTLERIKKRVRLDRMLESMLAGTPYADRLVPAGELAGEVRRRKLPDEIEGIHSAFSSNVKPPHSGLNHRSSGRETRKPRTPKRLPISR